MIFQRYVDEAAGDEKRAFGKLVADLMRGDAATFKQGYTVENAVIAAFDAAEAAGYKFEEE